MFPMREWVMPVPRIKILGFQEMRNEQVAGVDLVVSITDSARVPLPFTPGEGRLIRAHFRDLEPDEADGLERRIIDFEVRKILTTSQALRLTPSSSILVHCHEGVSRSSAVALSLLIQMGFPIEEAFLHLWNLRPQMLPNQLVLDAADEILNLGGKLTEFGKRIRGSIRSVREAI